VEIWVGLKDETLKGVTSREDLKPLLVRLALEKGVKFLSDLFNPQPPSRVENGPKAVVNELRQTGSTMSPVKSSP
jgi:hypothetical protein